ncbi:MAG: MBL fold metallo-hydrolase, partial [Chloroflexi bacterium]|nr:MBL fold metallo-hydrolase [Chloroflexota bacterium]
MSASSATSSPKLTFLGAAGTVTGSKYLLEHAGQQLLVDCGLFQGPKRWRVHNWDTPPFDVAGLDAIVLTHAHIDHTGYLPRLVALGYERPIYATPETIALLELLLPDSGHLQEEEAEYANRRGYSKHHPALPLYTKKQAVASLRLLQPLPYHQERELLSGIRVRPADAGHIFGSAILELDLTGRSQRVRLVCSGDLGRYHQPLLRDPEPVAEADFLLLESTYGSRVHGQTAPTDALADAVHAVQETGGALIVPAFAVGRTQQLLYYLRELVQAKRIPALPVYVDSPMATEATRVFRRLSGSFDAETQALQRDGSPALAYPNLHFV